MCISCNLAVTRELNVVLAQLCCRKLPGNEGMNEMERRKHCRKTLVIHFYWEIKGMLMWNWLASMSVCSVCIWCLRIISQNSYTHAFLCFSMSYVWTYGLLTVNCSTLLEKISLIYTFLINIILFIFFDIAWGWPAFYFGSLKPDLSNGLFRSPVRSRSSYQTLKPIDQLKNSGSRAQKV